MFEEELGAQDVPSDEAYLQGVRSANVYIGLFGTRYGARTRRGFSATEEEYREAENRGLRLCIFVNSDGGQVDGAQRDLIDGARNLLTTSAWVDPADLGRRVTRRLADLAAEDLAPWVRLGDTVFRATQIKNFGDSISVEAEIQNPRIITRLNEIRDGRMSNLRFTSSDESRPVQLKELTSSMTSNIGRSVALTLLAGQPEQSMRFGSVQTNGVTYSQEDMTKLSIADGLFGTTTSPKTWGGAGETVDLLEPLRGQGFVDAVVRPVARLLITERLLSRGDASHVDAFALGPSRNDVRTLRLTWTPVRTYTNSPMPDSVTVEGQLVGL